MPRPAPGYSGNKRHELSVLLDAERVVLKAWSCSWGFTVCSTSGITKAPRVCQFWESVFLPKLLFQLGLLLLPGWGRPPPELLFSASCLVGGIFSALGFSVFWGALSFGNVPPALSFFRFIRFVRSGLRPYRLSPVPLFSLCRLFLFGHNFINHSAGNINDVSGAILLWRDRRVSLFRGGVSTFSAS